MAEANNQWAVVEFTSSETVSTVPAKWIDKNGLTCLWPANKVGSKIRRMADPDETWEIHAIRIVTTTASCQDGRAVEKKLSDCDTEGENVTTTRAKKKKFLDFVSDFDTEAPNKVVKYSEKSVTLKDMPTFPGKNEPIIEKEKNVVDSLKNKSSEISDIEEPFYQEGVDSFVERTINGCSSNDTLSVTDEDLMPPPSVSPTVSHNKRTLETLNAGCCCKHGEDINKILQIVVQVKVAVQEQNRIIKVNMSSRNIEENSMKITNFDTIPKKPFISYKKLMLYEDKLRNSDLANNQLETAVYLCGGTCPKEAIKRGLGKIFGDKLARRCSWTGRKNNLPLKHLNVMQIIKIAVRKRFSTLSDKEYEGIVSTWFRQADLRFQRANQKEEKN